MYFAYRVISWVTTLRNIMNFKVHAASVPMTVSERRLWGWNLSVFMNHSGGAEPVAKSCALAAQAHKEIWRRLPRCCSVWTLSSLLPPVPHKSKLFYNKAKFRLSYMSVYIDVAFPPECIHVIRPVHTVDMNLAKGKSVPSALSSPWMMTGVWISLLCLKSFSLSCWHWAANGPAFTRQYGSPPVFLTVFSWFSNAPYK